MIEFVGRAKVKGGAVLRWCAAAAMALAGMAFVPAAQAVTVTASPSFCTQSAIAGGQNWSNPGQAAVSDNAYASVGMNDGQYSDYLTCSGFGFSLPAGATINGITVNVERQASNDNSVNDYRVRLLKGGVVQSGDRATGTYYTPNDLIEAHGGATDLWAGTWTAADINASNFGVAFASHKPGDAGQVRTAYVDAIQVSIDYTPLVCSPPSSIPAEVRDTLTCLCDTFDRAALNPSPIFGSNWIVSTSDSSGIVPSIVNSGYLRLTNNTGNNAKAATVPGIFPAAGNYISVEFQHFAYNGSGADGIAVTLSDYSVPPVPGAFGGSLGYAQKTGIPGFAGGWLGVALDEYGNYSNATEGRLGGVGFHPQSVGARGSGSGTTGYRWLDGVLELSPEVDNNGSSTPSRGHYYQVIVDARGEPTSTSVQVNRDTGSGYSSLISIPNVYAAATANGFTQAPVPANWQISLTGSTGGSTNIYEIAGLRICAQTVHPPSGGTASSFNAIDEGYGTPPLAVQNYLTGHIYMKLVGVPFKLNVAALDNNQIQQYYVVSGSKDVTVKLVNNSDNVCVLDSTNPNYCNSSCRAKPAVSGGSQTLAFAASNAGQKQSANFTLNTAYSQLVAIISDGTTTACSTDAFSVRPTGIASVTSRLAKLALTADGSALNFAAAVSAPAFLSVANGRIRGAGFPTAWSAGQAVFDGTVTVSSLNTAVDNRAGPDGPFVNLALGIAPVDSDGVRILAYDLDADNSGSAEHKTLASTTLYFGQLWLIPVIGSELLPLAMRAELLRWNGTAFVPNGDDSCTKIPLANLGLSDWKGNLSAGETAITPGGLNLAAGVGTIRLSAPGAGNNGSVKVTADVNAAGLPYLGGHWSGAKYDQNPSALASFGLYKGVGKILHLRENY